MAKFAELNDNLMDVLIKLISSQNLCKLLQFPVDNPYLESNIEDTSSLLFDKVFPIPKIPTVSETQESYLTVIFDNFGLNGNIKFKDALLVFNIYCHIDLWQMTGTGKLRPYAIMEEIDKLLNDQRVIGLGKMQFSRSRFIAANEKYMGYRLEYNVLDFN